MSIEPAHESPEPAPASFELKQLKRTKKEEERDRPKLKLPALDSSAPREEIRYEPAAQGDSYDVADETQPASSDKPATREEVTGWFFRLGGPLGPQILAKENADKVEQLLSGAIGRIDRGALPQLFSSGLNLRRRADPDQIPELRELEGQINLADRAARSLEQVLKQGAALFVRPVQDVMAGALKTPIDRLIALGADRVDFAARLADELERMQWALLIAAGPGLSSAQHGNGESISSERINKVLKYEPLSKATEAITRSKNLSAEDRERARLEKQARIKEGVAKKGPVLPDEADVLREENVKASRSRVDDARAIAAPLRDLCKLISIDRPSSEQMEALRKLYLNQWDTGAKISDDEILLRQKRDRVGNFARALAQWFDDECKVYQTSAKRIPEFHELQSDLAASQVRLEGLRRGRERQGRFFEVAHSYLNSALKAVAHEILATEAKTGVSFNLSQDHRQQVKFLAGSAEERIAFTDTTNEISEAARKAHQAQLEAEQARHEDKYNRWKK